MKNKVIYTAIILLGYLLFCKCKQEVVAPDFSQPVIEQYVDKSTVIVGGESIVTGPLKDYETDSEVVYKITITSKKPLAKFKVSSSSDAVSQLSKIVKTEPEGAIDLNGNFTKEINKIVIYYSYHIHPLVSAMSQVTVTFTAFDNGNNASSVSHDFGVIKKGSTNGNILNIINLQYTDATSRGINTQYALLDGSEGTRPEAQTNRSGPMFSFKHKFGLTNDADAITQASNIDFIGYQTLYAGTSPLLVNNNFYLVSPYDTVVLTSSYAGAVAASLQLQGSSGTANITLAGITRLATFKSNVSTTASDFVTANKTVYANAGLTLATSSGKLTWTATKSGVGFEPVIINNLTGNLNGINEDTKITRKNLIMRNTIRQMSKKLKDEGKELRKVYFKRLDNIPGPNRVTPSDFDILTHDNEFDTLLAGIQESGQIRTEPMGLNQVYGFVMSDGKRGLFRTSPPNIFLSGVQYTVPLPNASWNLYGVIKFQNAK